jgi:hypothetical protein
VQCEAGGIDSGAASVFDCTKFPACSLCYLCQQLIEPRSIHFCNYTYKSKKANVEVTAKAPYTTAFPLNSLFQNLVLVKKSGHWSYPSHSADLLVSTGLQCFIYRYRF